MGFVISAERHLFGEVACIHGTEQQRRTSSSFVCVRGFRFAMAAFHGRQGGDWRAADWLGSLRVYLAWIFVLNLLWETLHLPLYTLWESSSLSEKAFAVVHCTFGDVLIALSALALALVLAGDPKWPMARFRTVAVLALIFSEVYTLYSEWVNVFVRASWAYSDRMPVIAVLGHGIGLSPLLQWIAVPIVSLSMLWRARAKGENPSTGQSG